MNDGELRVFRSRDRPDYVEILTQLLSLETKNPSYPGLIESAYPLTPETADRLTEATPGLRIDKIINIDLLGMTGAVLLDSKSRAQQSQFHQFRNLIEHIQELNERHGIGVRIRILLQYPYSQAGQNRILAEVWDRRSFIGDSVSSHRDETLFAKHLVEANVNNSHLLGDQEYCLRTFRRLRRQASKGLKRGGPNRLDLRFACISTLHCGLRINDRYFCDPYHYGRLEEEESCAFNLTPVVMVQRSADEHSPGAFEAFCNHFRYVWECDSTLEYDDVVQTDDETSTVTILAPSEIKAEAKIKRLQHKGPKGSLPKKADHWASYSRSLSRIVERICPFVGKVDAPEKGFIVAAWASEGGRMQLCKPAHMIDKFFKEDFPEDGTDVRVTFLRGILGQELSDELIRTLDESTFGIVILTKGAETPFGKPNVYLEMGYLLKRNGRQRTFVAHEKGVEFPSDIAGLVNCSFVGDSTQLESEMLNAYCEIIRGMEKTKIISPESAAEILARRTARPQTRAERLPGAGRPRKRRVPAAH